MAKPGDQVEAWLTALGHVSADRDYNPGHERIHALLTDLNLPQPRLRIRVAGTNGKGSTAGMMATAFQACGFTVGLYSSPHIQVFNERIRVDQHMITDHELYQLMQHLMPAALDVGASYFEVATALALIYFSRKHVDIEILEAGVGARLDATTAVPADMAVITPIALDHQDWLGETLSEIVQEKKHVVDGCRWVVSAPQEEAVKVALQAYCPMILFSTHEEACLLPSLAMVGEHQRWNAATALRSLTLLVAKGFPQIDLKKVMSAIAETRITGRLQFIRYKGHALWLDAAHNLHAIQSLLPSLKSLADPFDVIFIFSREDRDLSEAIPLLRPYTHKIVADYAYESVVDVCYASIRSALDVYLAEGSPPCRFLVLGSFVTVAQAERWFSELPTLIRR
ncbi:MAG: Mur ligase family protein [Mariprofundaceae bacterium]